MTYKTSTKKDILVKEKTAQFKLLFDVIDCGQYCL